MRSLSVERCRVFIDLEARTNCNCCIACYEHSQPEPSEELQYLMRAVRKPIAHGMPVLACRPRIDFGEVQPHRRRTQPRTWYSSEPRGPAIFVDSVGTRPESVVNRRERFDRGSWAGCCWCWKVCDTRLRGGDTKAFMVVASLRGECWARKRVSFGSIFATTTILLVQLGTCARGFRTRPTRRSLLVYYA